MCVFPVDGLFVVGGVGRRPRAFVCKKVVLLQDLRSTQSSGKMHDEMIGAFRVVRYAREEGSLCHEESSASPGLYTFVLSLD